MFRAEGRLPERPPLQSLKTYRDDRRETYKTGGLFNSNGEDWYQSRSTVQQPFLRIDNIMNYSKVLDQVSQEFIERYAHRTFLSCIVIVNSGTGFHSTGFA